MLIVRSFSHQTNPRNNGDDGVEILKLFFTLGNMQLGRVSRGRLAIVRYLSCLNRHTPLLPCQLLKHPFWMI